MPHPVNRRQKPAWQQARRPLPPTPRPAPPGKDRRGPGPKNGPPGPSPR